MSPGNLTATEELHQAAVPVSARYKISRESKKNAVKNLQHTHREANLRDPCREEFPPALMGMMSGRSACRCE